MIKKFVSYMRDERAMSDNTVSGYLTDITQFSESINKNIKEVNMKDIEKFIYSLRKNGISVTTTNRKLASLKLFFKFLNRDGYINSNPTLLIESGKTEKKLPRPISEESINKISSSAKSIRDKAIIETLYGAGLRRSELICLKKSDIDWSKGLLHVTGKGKKDRIIPLNGYALSLLKRYSDSHNSGWVFPSRKNSNNHISTRRLNEIISYYSELAGVEGVTPHVFRHSFGSHLFDKGMDSRVLQDLMGHESINTTSTYAKVSTSRNIIEYNKYFNREEPLTSKTNN